VGWGPLSGLCGRRYASATLTSAIGRVGAPSGGQERRCAVWYPCGVAPPATGVCLRRRRRKRDRRRPSIVTTATVMTMNRASRAARIRTSSRITARLLRVPSTLHRPLSVSAALSQQTIFRTGRLETPSMPVSSSTRPALPPQPSSPHAGSDDLEPARRPAGRHAGGAPAAGRCRRRAVARTRAPHPRGSVMSGTPVPRRRHQHPKQNLLGCRYARPRRLRHPLVCCRFRLLRPFPARALAGLAVRRAEATTATASACNGPSL
jgi:hypothetical protein